MSILEPASAANRPAEADGVRVCVARHELTIFVHSTSLIASMVRDIAAAKERVWLESYIIADDAAGEAIAAALVERASAGVDTRVLYDGFGSIRTPEKFFERLKRKGVQVHAFHTFGQALREFAFLRVLNRRDHRKLLIIDGGVAYFGGMNIVDQRGIDTVEDAKARHLPPSGAWRDVHVRLSGPQQTEIAAAFDRLWRLVHRQKKGAWPAWPVKKMQRSQGERMYFFDCRPFLRYRRAERIFVPLIRGARRSITVSMAYFIPQGKVLRELVRARKRGVVVRIIIPGKSDVPIVQRATRYFYAYLLKRGFRIFEQNDNMLHSKVMVIDREWSIVGSCNLDPRSLFFNLEFLAAIYAPSAATVIERICRYEMRKSRRVIRADIIGRSWKQRFLDYIAWKLRKWL